MKNKGKTINSLVDIVVPCFNEEFSLPKVYSEFNRMSGALSNYRFNLLIIDNGSTDKTLDLARSFLKNDERVKVIELSRNFGKEASLSAGLYLSTGDVVVPLDADMQDPLEVVPIMLKKWEEGLVDVVLGKRKSRSEDSFRRRISSSMYIKLFRRVTEVDLPMNVGEFRLMDRSVVDAFNQLPETERFVRGLFSWLGFKTEIVEYDRPSREKGKSRFSYSRLFDLAVNGLLSFSIKPLRFVTLIGLLGSVISVFYGFWIISLAISGKIVIQGYASLLAAVLFLGSLQLLSLGVVGEYVGKTLLESKRRPIFVVRKVYQSNGK